MYQGGVDKVIYKELSYKIVGVLYDVYNELGFGYQEKFYEKAIAEGLDGINIYYLRQAPYQIVFRSEIIGRNYIDFVIENKIVLEIKRGDYFSQKNIEQIKGI
jgi:GxxExxY protein